MMKVCIICAGLPPFYGGAELRAYRHAQRLHAAEGVEAVLIGWDRSGNRTADDSFPSYVNAVKLRFQEVKDVQSPVSFLKLWLHLTELSIRFGLFFAVRHEFDVIHIINASPLFNLVPIPIAKAFNKPVILEMTLLGSDDPLKLNRRIHHPEKQVFPHRPLKYSLFLKADAYVSKSHAMSEVYRQAGLPEARLFQIPSGVDTEKFKPPTLQEKRALRNKLRLGEEQIIILFVGPINERKGVHRLFAAFSQVVPHHPKSQLLIVGPSRPSDATYLQTFHQDIAALGLSEKVILVNQMVDHVDDFMKAADIFVLPTSHEGLSVAILEAMSSGLAVVASDIPEIALSQIRHEIEGLLLPVGDTIKVADAMTKFITDAALRARLGQAARQRVLEEFSHEIVDSQYINLYKHCLECGL